ncbi:paired amphipathic helix repeat-containing protein [Nitzschia inconspicua]|uniref:Paired amphipathic helix repeat-containing protein n=1 Tax=Nitzschia inconspicua TaxID=303405 RepID=A0A9K3Q3M2_9STRA|nr:paired amphipathic helix repeat-containing protein [Nitzschia inconspicua]
MRELRVEDALLYLDQVKVEFGDRPHIYNEFLDIMKTFKTQQIDTPGVIRRVSNLFQGNRRLVLGFNTFLPEGYKIELPDGDGPPVAVFRAPGETITHVLTGSGGIIRHTEPNLPSVGAASGVEQKPPAMVGGRPVAGLPLAAGQGRGGPPGLEGLIVGRGTDGRPQQPGGISAAAAAVGFASQPASVDQRGVVPSHIVGGPPGAVRGTGRPMEVAPPIQEAGRTGMVAGQVPIAGATNNNPKALGAGAPTADAVQQPLEFDHAINYVTTIKKRFSDEPETYKKFLEILHTYQKEQRGIKEVLEEVSVLFSEHPDLLREFTFFLPDAVQSEAKTQLEVVVKEAEERKRLKTAAATAVANQPPPVMQRAPAPRVTAPVTTSSTDARLPPQPVAAVSSSMIAFGATAPRSAEREKEIQRSAVYGKVTFGPSRPPRKNALNALQAAQKAGRPSMLPPLPPQPSTAESAFFERARRHLSRRELSPDKPSGRVKHTPYAEFLKSLHLYACGILNKEELVMMLRGLFVQGHAPKSGINAGGGASNPSIMNDAHELMKEFEEVLIGRGPYADQQNRQKDKSRYGCKRTRDFDFKDAKRPTPSYVEYPKDYPVGLFITHTGQTDDDSKVQNHTLFCVGAEDQPASNASPEDYDAVRIRCNTYEEAMFKIEDERFEVDMAIERNALAMRQIEPIAEEVQMLREGEEKDGQPIGRLQYKLNSRTLNSIQINAIGRVYGENGDEVIQHLARNPMSVLPIVYQRLRQKDQEWRKQKSEMMPRWKAGCEANYEGSMDYLCYPKRRALERRFGLEHLREECKLAREYCSNPDKSTGGGAVSFGLSVPDRSAVMYEPYVVVEMKLESPVHHDAVKLLMHYVKKKCLGMRDVREKIGRIWTEFMISFFGYPSNWVIDEARESFCGKINDVVVKYASGQRVQTALGVGTIQAFLNTDAGPRYRVKLPFGSAVLQPYAILHNVDARDGSKYLRRDEEMVKESNGGRNGDTSVTVDQKFKVLFGSDNIYLFLRLYAFLVSLLDEVQEYLQANPTAFDPSQAYYNPIKSGSGDTMMQKVSKLDYVSVISNLRKVIDKATTPKEFETFCRRVNRDIVYKMAALPRLVEKCGDMMIKVSEEELLPRLFDLCQYTGQNPVSLRNACLVISSDVSYRIQYNTTNGRLYFSYLPGGEELSTVPVGDDDDDDDDDEEMEDGEAEDDFEDDDDVDLENEEEDLREAKRMKR